jgi:hypothetical protein
MRACCGRLEIVGLVPCLGLAIMRPTVRFRCWVMQGSRVDLIRSIGAMLAVLHGQEARLELHWHSTYGQFLRSLPPDNTTRVQSIVLFQAWQLRSETFINISRHRKVFLISKLPNMCHTKPLEDAMVCIQDTQHPCMHLFCFHTKILRYEIGDRRFLCEILFSR